MYLNAPLMETLEIKLSEFPEEEITLNVCGDE
jgi:hypothetical protein